MSNIAIIGAPVDLGAGRRGVDMGPSAIRYAGLQEQLEALGLRVRDMGNIAVPLPEQIEEPRPGEKLRYLSPLVRVNQSLAQQVAGCVAEGAFPLVLGGDHSIAIGSVAGSSQRRRLGLLWVDAHADFNTPETTPSGNIHGMSVAALSGRGHPALTDLARPAPVLQDGDIALIAVRDIDPLERVALQQSGVHTFTMHDIDRRGLYAVVEEAIARISAHTDGFHVSLDMDSLDPREAPGVGTPVLGGLSYREAHLIMELVAEAGRMASMDVVEVNPILDERNRTAELAVQFVLSALGKRTL